MADLVNSIPCGVLVFDDGGKILETNETLQQWLGFAKHELENKTIDSILTLASRIFYNTHFFPLVKLHSSAEEIFLTLLTQNREDVPVLSNTVRREYEGRVVNICSFIRVFQRKKYEEEILQARRTAEDALRENEALQSLSRKLETRTQELDRQLQRMVAVNKDIVQFSKIVSHDLQEPIRKIRLFANMLEMKLPQSTELSRPVLGKIQSSADRLAHLTTGLHQYVNIDLAGDLRETNLNEVLAEAAEKVTNARAFNGLQLDSEPLPSIEGYPALLELLFYHLLDNAIKFRKPDQELVVKVKSTLLDENIYRALPDKYRFLEHVRIVFSDNGIGFDDQYKDYVFQLVKKIDPQSKGLGIGLALSKKIVDNHNGSIRIESRPGSGTQIFLVFPLRLSNLTSVSEG